MNIQLVADFSRPETVEKYLGIGFGRLMERSDSEELSITQQICSTLERHGFEGVILPSYVVVGKTNLVIFTNNLHSRNALLVERADALSGHSERGHALSHR